MPQLTDIERLTLQTLRLHAENAALRASAAQREFELYGLALRAQYGGEAVQCIREDGTVVMAEPIEAEE